ncbi:MAG: CDP-alcohol phosphatidyltransferase family protein [Clostridiaceae bacterium]|nr:CDP-alcohol phosphatidyltransferase family protein [Clostridiaceae bacterium]
MIGFYNYTVIVSYLGVAASVLGIGFAMTGRLTYAVACLMFSGLCDAFDGPIARTKGNRTDAEKRFGIQLDSLQDIVCFGVLPAAIGYGMGMHGRGQTFLLIIYVLAGLTRLAYFNVTEELRQDQTDERRAEYEGLPITSAALVIPLIYGFNKFLTQRELILVYSAALICLSLAFLARIHFKKPHGWGVLMLVLAGMLEFVWVLL